MDLLTTLQTLASGRLGAAMKQVQLPALFTHKLEQGHQRGVGRNALPFTHHTLRINDFAGQHGATVHGKLQHVNHLFAAVHFHVRACGNVVSTALRFLGRFVIEQAPERSDVARFFNGSVVDVDGARVVSQHFLPLGMGGVRGKQQNQGCGHSGTRLGQAPNTVEARRIFKSIADGIHAPYYKVVH